MKNKQPFKAGKIRNLWLIIANLCITVHHCALTIIISLCSCITVQWYDRRVTKWAKGILKVTKVNYHIHNPHQVEIDQFPKCILMSNHNSLFDIPLIVATFPGRTRMMAKVELSKIPVFGRALRVAGFPFVDRSGGRGALATVKAVQQSIEAGVRLWIAPEGTRSTTGRLGPLKNGGFRLALATHAVIVPIGIRNSERIIAKKSLQFGLYQKVDIHIGKAISTRDYTKNDLNQLKALVEQELLVLKGEALP